MLQFFREKLQGCIVWIIVGLIVVVFILGATSYLFHRNYNDTIAKVDGEEISLNIVNQKYQNVIKQHYAKKNYKNLDLDPQKLKKQIFDQLLDQVAVIKGLQRSGFNVTEEQLLGIVKGNPSLQVNGKFSRQKYLAWLNNLGVDELNYENFLKQQLLLEQITNIILFANFIPSEDLDNFLLKWYQTRKIGYLIVPRVKFPKPIIKEQDLEAYYLKNKKDLLSPETVKLQYVDVSANKLIEKVVPTREQLYKYYNEHPEYYTLPPLVNVRHILVNFTANDKASKNINDSEAAKVDPTSVKNINDPKAANVDLAKVKNANDPQKAANVVDPARVKIEEILEKLRSGANFKELAKTFSEDRNSAVKGGDLGWIGKDEIDPNFNAAAFNLKNNGDFSEIVKSKFGYHIIQLIDKRENKLSKFEEILDKITNHYKEEEVQPKLQELYDKLTEASIKNTDLVKLAKELNLPLQVTNDFSSRGESTGVASYGEIVAAAFNQKVLNHNSEVIRLADDHFVIFRVIEHKPVRTKDFLEALDEIKKTLEEQHINQQAQQYAQGLALQLAKAKDPNKVARSANLEWKIVNINRDNKTIALEVLQAAFSLPQVNTQKVFNLVNGDFLILQLLQIQDADLPKLLTQHPDLKVKIQEQLLQLQSYVEQKLYAQELYNSAKIKIIKNIDEL